MFISNYSNIQKAVILPSTLYILTLSWNLLEIASLSVIWSNFVPTLIISSILDSLTLIKFKVFSYSLVSLRNYTVIFLLFVFCLLDFAWLSCYIWNFELATIVKNSSLRDRPWYVGSKIQILYSLNFSGR